MTRFFAHFICRSVEVLTALCVVQAARVIDTLITH